MNIQFDAKIAKKVLTKEEYMIVDTLVTKVQEAMIQEYAEETIQQKKQNINEEILNINKSKNQHDMPLLFINGIDLTQQNSKTGDVMSLINLLFNNNLDQDKRF